MGKPLQTSLLLMMIWLLFQRDWQMKNLRKCREEGIMNKYSMTLTKLAHAIFEKYQILPEDSLVIGVS